MTLTVDVDGDRDLGDGDVWNLKGDLALSTLVPLTCLGVVGEVRSITPTRGRSSSPLLRQPITYSTGPIAGGIAWEQENPQDAYERLYSAESGLLLSLRNAELCLAKLNA